jgi:MFS family permease
MIFMTIWNFAANLAAPFFSVYMLTMLNYPMGTVTLLTVLSQGANLLSLRIWGRLADRFSNKSVLAVCAPLFIVCILGWTFTTWPELHTLTLPLVVALNILTGIATAGVTLANGNIALKLAPDGKATSYLAANCISASLAAGIAPILGGLFADLFAHQELSLVLHWHATGNALAIKTLDFHYWDFFFALAFIIGLFSLSRLGKVQETGHAGNEVILKALMTDVFRAVNRHGRHAGKTCNSLEGPADCLPPR